MFSFVKKDINLGSKPNDKSVEEMTHSGSDAYSDISDTPLEELNASNNDFNLNNIFSGDKCDENYIWNEEWNAFEEMISPKLKICLDVDVSHFSVKGVVTQFVHESEIIINGTQPIKFDRCYITDLCIGDMVSVEISEDGVVTVKPLRYKILTSKIAGFGDTYSQFIFSEKALIIETLSTHRLNIGDVLKCVVIETTSNHLNWRAYPYPQVYDQWVNTDHKIEPNNEMDENKNGIEIEPAQIDFGDMKLKTIKSIYIWIKNRGQTPQKLVSAQIENESTGFSPQVLCGIPPDPLYIIQVNGEGLIELRCEALYSGHHKEVLVFKFVGFEIRCFASVKVEDHNSADQLSLKRPYDTTDDICIPTEERASKLSKHFHRLNEYSVPKELRQTLEKRLSIHCLFPELAQQINKTNYRNRFHALLYLEECQNEIILTKFDMTDVTFQRVGQFFALTVPGLADGQPSLVPGGKIQIFREKKPKINGITAIIQEVRTDDIVVRFKERYQNDITRHSFKVVFLLNRIVYRRCHHAIDLTPQMADEVLFPNENITKPPVKKIAIKSINWFNTSLNNRQKMAVVGALRGHCRPTPFIIIGPPGTGKTATIVESILQAFDKIGESRIIACTAANSSADLIAQKLLESKRVTQKDMIRVTAFHRVNSVPAALQCVSQIADKDPKKWLFHRIIVTTTSHAGIVFKQSIPFNHFTHVFIDEAAQVTEPESLIPISLCAIGGGVVVLAGDHKQLGPLILSEKANSRLLGRSLMERLITTCNDSKFNIEFQKYGYYNPKFVVKLVNNYRSDSQIMKIPSQLFYENELKFYTKTDHKLIISSKLNSAVNFIGVIGEDIQDPECPSWYNSEEAIEVCSLLQGLYKGRVDPKDIGILTPYRKQVIKIRQQIEEMKLNDCRVATIEEFQGLEKRVIILSMVRSVQKNRSFGFVLNAKRFNVAISRAMSLLVVIGNPILLSRDYNWQQFINFCIEKKCYSGCQFRTFGNSIDLNTSWDD